MQQRGEETRSHILEVASQLFSKNGYEATGVAEICQAAGISKGAFYHHFPTKQAVFLTLLESWLSNIEAGFALVRQKTHDIPNSLLEMAEMVGNIYQAADVRLSILLEFWMHAFRDPIIWQATIAPYHRYQAYFTDLIRAGMSEGSLRPVNPELAARVLTSLATGLLMQALFESQEVDWKNEVRQSLEVLLEGLLSKEVGK